MTSLLAAMVLALAAQAQPPAPQPPAAQPPPTQQPPAQQPPAQQPPQDPATPTFRATVDRVPVDVNIVDRDGRPIPELEATDFMLKVDGRARRVVSVQYVPSVRQAGPRRDTPEHYSSNDAAGGGRMIMLAVDQGNIGIGRGRVALESASKFISSLSPADRVGLVTLPGAGPQIDFTEHHQLVRTMLSKVVGQDTGYTPMYRIGMAEAAEIHKGNQLALIEVQNRECTGLRGIDLEICIKQILADSATIYTLARERARSSMASLRHLLDRMSLIPSQKTIIYVSEGLVVDRELAELAWLPQAAARAQAVFYVLQLEGSPFEASIGRPSPTQTQDRMMNEEGLGMLAGITRGALMRVVASADSAFQRLALELSGYYLLSFEPEPGDRDGKSHKISVGVPGRDGVTVRARSEFMVGEPRVRSADEVLTETLQAPLISSDIPLKLSAYTLRDEKSGKLRILFAAEIDRSGNASQSISLAYVLLDAKGAGIGGNILRNVPALPPNAPPIQQYLGSIAADTAGMYTLKLAVVDELGRRGSVEHNFRAHLESAGQLRVTDLLIGERPAGTTESARPAVTGELSSDFLHGYLEVYSDAGTALDNFSVRFEVASKEEGVPLDSVDGRLVSSLATTNRRVVEGAVPIGLLPPGDYIARAIVNLDGKRVGQVVRPFKVPTTRTTSAVALAARGGNRPVIPFASRIDGFERTSVLTPEVVGFFMERLNFGSSPGPGAAAAVDHARSGRFEEAISSLASTERQQLATLFVQGLSAYSKGDLKLAMEKFRETLKLDSEFFPAAFYLGSSYAAGGHDRQAVGAWQTSLVTESDAPFIYTLLADAFLRLRDVDAALDILDDAKTLWPGNDQIQLRLGTAYAMQGNPAEALKVLDPYLARNPSDHERYFVALRAIYDARTAGTSIKSPPEDAALFERYAAAYKSAGGPQVALVEQWQKFIKKGPGI
jgi:VWFA-related protein